MKIRNIAQTVLGIPAQDGAGVKLVRVLGNHTTKAFDPFLMLDAFDSQNPADYIKGFPFHPHRGIETVTYLTHGNIEHQDSLGNKDNIRDGGAQWMTAGGGIIHQEMPLSTPRMQGLQLWLNLPAKDKMTPPKYQDLPAETIPKVVSDGATVGVIAGQYEGTSGPSEGDFVKLQMLDVALEPGVHWGINVPQENTVFAYIFAGYGESDGDDIEHHSVVRFADGDRVEITAGDEGLHFALFSAKPLNEPIAWYGPIVMNTNEELAQASADLRDGTFAQFVKM